MLWPVNDRQVLNNYFEPCLYYVLLLLLYAFSLCKSYHASGQLACGVCALVLPEARRVFSGGSRILLRGVPSISVCEYFALAMPIHDRKWRALSSLLNSRASS